VLGALEAEAAGDLDRAMDFYSTGGEWQLVDPFPGGILGSAPCEAISWSFLERHRCIGRDELRALKDYLADQNASFEITDVRTARTQNRLNTREVIGETDVVYVRARLGIEPPDPTLGNAAEVLTVYALREGEIRTFAAIILGYEADDSPPGGTPAADTIYGMYSTTVKPADIVEASHSGLWDIAFLPDGRYFLYDQGHLSLTGHFQVSGEQVTITDDSDCAVPEPGVHGGDETSTYEWSVSREDLRLTPVEDGCPIRENILTSEPWTRQPQ
jgi:hypothetical protein